MTFGHQLQEEFSIFDSINMVRTQEENDALEGPPMIPGLPNFDDLDNYLGDH